MLIQWSEQSAKWFRTASEYTGFHEKLVQLILPDIQPEDELCDLGCGAAMVDFALSDHVRAISCVDKNPDAIAAVEREIARRGVGNIETLCCDAYGLDRQWDTVLLVFFGRIAENVEHYLKLCRKNVIAVVRGGENQGFDGKRYISPHRYSAAQTAQVLDARGVNYRLRNAVLEYGQPLESMEDALSYITAYKKYPPEQEPAEYLAGNLSCTGDESFPYYLPYEKHMGIFEISREDNLHLLSQH